MSFSSRLIFYSWAFHKPPLIFSSGFDKRRYSNTHQLTSYAERGCAIRLHYCSSLSAHLGYVAPHMTERFLPGKLSQNVINQGSSVHKRNGDEGCFASGGLISAPPMLALLSYCFHFLNVCAMNIKVWKKINKKTATDEGIPTAGRSPWAY